MTILVCRILPKKTTGVWYGLSKNYTSSDQEYSPEIVSFQTLGGGKVGFPPPTAKLVDWNILNHKESLQKYRVSKLKTTLESHRTKSDKLKLTLKKSLFIENRLDSWAWRFWLSSSKNILNFKKTFGDAQVCWVSFYIDKHATICIILPWKFEIWCRSLNFTPFCKLKR